jgi:hypothetical protein
MARAAVVLFAVVAMMTIVAFWGGEMRGRVDAQSAPSFRLDPASQDVASGAQFEVKVIQTTPFAPTGAQADLQFDPSLLQVVGVEAGEPYASATFLVGVAPQTTQEAIGEANTTGLLKNMAVFILPGTGTAGSAGDNVAFKLTMKAREFSGTSSLKLAGFVQMLDENGGCYGCPPGDAGIPVLGPVTASDASVNVTGGGAPPPPGAVPPATPTAGGTATIAAATPAPRTPLASVTFESAVLAETTGISGNALSVEPAESRVGKGDDFSITVKARSDQPVSGVSLQLEYDAEAADVSSIELGADWADATGADEASLEAAVGQANDTGSIELSLLATGSEAVAAGETTVAVIKMHSSDSDTKSNLRFVSGDVQSADGNPITVTFENGLIIVGNGGASGNSMYTWALVFLVLLAMGGTAFGSYYMIRRRRRQWAV